MSSFCLVMLFILISSNGLSSGLTLTPKQILTVASTTKLKSQKIPKPETVQEDNGTYEFKFTSQNSPSENYIPKKSFFGNERTREPVLEHESSANSKFPSVIKDTTEFFQTFFLDTTKTHLIRVTTTSDVWVTSVIEIPKFFTQYSTERRYVTKFPNTVTSVLKTSVTSVTIVTQTIGKVNLKTEVSVLTIFVTTTVSLGLFHPVIHFATSFEALYLPVYQTKTLLQMLTSTTTVRIIKEVTSTKYPVQSLHFLRF